MADASIDQADHHVRFVTDGVLADGRLIPKQKLASDLQMPAGGISIHPGYTLRNGKPMHDGFAAEDPDYDLQIYNGKPLKHDFGFVGTSMEYKLDGTGISQTDYQRYRLTAPEAVPPHELLMMGDNRNDSRDSTEWGLLDDKRVVGRAVFIFWPLNRMHPIR
jgi:signal peptidase I